MLPGLIEKGFVVKADTIEELARKLGLPEKTLKATVERYNTLAQNSKDEDYGKEPHRLAALTKAPFYGAKNTGYILCTMDGIRIDTTMNAIDTDGNPIPGHLRPSRRQAPRPGVTHAALRPKPAKAPALSTRSSVTSRRSNGCFFCVFSSSFQQQTAAPRKLHGDMRPGVSRKKGIGS